MSGVISITRREVVEIDLLRFVCALLVVFSHFLLPLGGYDGWDSGGTAGVEVFFIISGFIIPYTAEYRSPFTFMRSRVVRLVPGVWICASLSIVAIYLSVGGHEHVGLIGRYVRSILFIPGVPWPVSSLDDVWVAGPYWTLFVEISFYSVVLCLLITDQFKRISMVATALGSITLIYWATYFLSRYVFPQNNWSQAIAKSDYARWLDLTLVHAGAWFGLGINFWLIGTRVTRERVLSIAICSMGCTLATIHSAIAERSSILLQLMFVTAGAAVVLAAVLANNARRYSQALRTAARWIGLTTYPLYLLHVPVGHALQHFGMNAHLSLDVATWLAIALTVILAAVVASTAEPLLQRMFGKCITHIETEIRPRRKFAALFIKTNSPNDCMGRPGKVHFRRP